MSHVLARILISIAAGQWLYSELALVFPDVHKATVAAVEYIQIPTHDKWDGLQERPAFRMLARTFARFQPKTAESSAATGQQADECRKILAHAASERRIPSSDTASLRRVAVDVGETLDDSANGDFFAVERAQSPFLSGTDIFESEAVKSAFRSRI